MPTVTPNDVAQFIRLAGGAPAHVWSALGGGQFRVVALSLDLEIVTVQAGLDEIAAAFSSLEEVGAIA